MKSLQAIDIVYKNAPDSQKVWIEATNRYWLEGGLRSFKRSLENHVELSKSLADSILRNLLKKPQLIVDIGAGYGGVAVNLAERGIKTIAVEPEADERRVIKYFLRKHKSARDYLSIVDGTAEKLPIRDNTVDLCILSQVLEHVDDPNKTIGEVYRVLKNGGYLHLSCPNYLFPVEQHYHLPYIPLMPKRLFAVWALFLLKTSNIRNIENPQKRNFSTVGSFIESVNYTTDDMVKKLCLKNNLKIIWSARDKQKNVFTQVSDHWQQNKSVERIPLIIISLPLKMVRSILASVGTLPMKLEYLITKN